MELEGYSEKIVRVALLVGVSVLALSLLIMLQVLLMHMRLVLHERRRKKFLDLWRPVLMRAMVGTPVELPRVEKSDYSELLALWIRLRESVRGESVNNIRDAALRAGMDKMAAKMIKGGGLHSRLLAISAIGYIGDKSAWGDLREALESENPALSLSAARAMVHIDPPEAVQELMPLIQKRKEWASFKVANILKEAGAEVFSAPLADAVAEAPEPRMIRFLSLATYDVAVQAVRKIINDSEDEEVISACLHVIKDPRDLPIVRGYLSHQSWFIRVQTAIVLGRIGLEEDKGELIKLLSDKEWWVRYRAAQALAGMPFVGAEELKRMKDGLTDRYARDIIDQVIAEKGQP